MYNGAVGVDHVVGVVTERADGCRMSEQSIPVHLRPRRFIMQRDHDKSGVSGTGIVATGVVFPDETVAYRWTTDPTTAQFAERIEDVQAIHGHGGATQLVWLD